MIFNHEVYNLDVACYHEKATICEDEGGFLSSTNNV